MGVQKKKKDWLSSLLMLGICLFALSAVWINFHSSQWYTFDMYADASFAALAAKEGTLFPADWVFGNQLSVIATPALAAILIPLVHDSVTAISLATCVMLTLILTAFYWCCKPFFSRRALMAGLFALSGGTVLGSGAATCENGMQILYTMASFYACYVWVFLFHVGAWMRLLNGRRLSFLLWVIVLAADLALGMQSLREMLILHIPLFGLSLLLLLFPLFENENPKRAGCCVRFAAASMAANLAGFFLRGALPIRVSPDYGKPQLRLHGPELVMGLRSSLNAFSEQAGLHYFRSNAKWWGLAILGLFLLALVLWALIRGLHRREQNSLPVILCVCSLAAVFVVCAVYFRARPIYYFVWYVTVPYTLAYLTDSLTQKRWKNVLCMGLLLCGLGSYVYNYYPDLKHYEEEQHYYGEIVDTLTDNGVTVIYGDYQAPVIAACSHGKITAVGILPNLSGEADSLVCPFGIPRNVQYDGETDPSGTALILSDSIYDLNSGYRMVENASQEYRDAFFTQFPLLWQFESPRVKYYVFAIHDPHFLQKTP